MSESLKILVLEDMAADAELIEHGLREAGIHFEVHRVDTRDNYLRAVHQYRPDVILSDYNLPQFDALAALRLLRENRLDIPFILVTGSQSEEVAVDCLRQGADDYILKDHLSRLPAAMLNILQKRARDRDRERAVTALRESEENFKAFMNHSPAIALMKDENGRFVYVNERWECQFPTRRTDWLGKTDYDFWPVDTADIFRKSDLAVLASGSSQAQVESGRTLEGEMRYWQTYKFVVKDEAGRRVVGGIVLDITEHKRLEAQLRQAQKMEAVGQLAAGVAHDFNNLLTVIQGHSSLLQASPVLDPLLRDSVAEIGQAADRAANLTRQLLTFSRKQPIQLKALKVNDLVANLTRMLHRIVGEDIALQCNYHPGLPVIFADASMIEQVIMNLVVNARDAMPRGGQLTISTISVEVSAEHARSSPDARSGGFVGITVSDNGCGMPPETLGRIFEPFFTTKEAGKGTGLGLATVYGIAKQHQGWVEVQSQVDKGTTFSVYLPTVSVEQKTEEEHFDAPGSANLRGGKEIILVVEDEKSVREMVKEVLVDFGYHVLEAESGKQALEVWRQSNARIDLLLTDMVMPEGVSGRELAQQLQAAKPALKVIYTSGYSVELIEPDFAVEEGLNFLRKPYRLQTLAKTVRNCLDHRG